MILKIDTTAKMTKCVDCEKYSSPNCLLFVMSNCVIECSDFVPQNYSELYELKLEHELQQTIARELNQES